MCNAISAACSSCLPRACPGSAVQRHISSAVQRHISHLFFLPAPRECRPPLVKVGSITPTSAVATVTPPATDRPWNSYTLTLCVKGTLDCTTTTCAAVADANSPTNCTLSSLSAGVTYTVTASARRSDGTQSPDSEPAQFTTLTYA